MNYYKVPVGISAVHADDFNNDFQATEYVNNIWGITGSFQNTWAARVGATTPTADEVTLSTCPQTVSSTQAKLALNSAGLYDQVVTYIATAPKAEQIVWQDATEFNINSPTLKTIATALNLNVTQLAALFTAAAVIVV